MESLVQSPVGIEKPDGLVEDTVLSVRWRRSGALPLIPRAPVKRREAAPLGGSRTEVPAPRAYHLQGGQGRAQIESGEVGCLPLPILVPDICRKHLQLKQTSPKVGDKHTQWFLRLSMFVGGSAGPQGKAKNVWYTIIRFHLLAMIAARRNGQL